MSEKTDRDNRQFRAGDNDYRRVTVKGTDPETFESASLVEYDPADDKYKAYTGAVITDTVRAVINLDEDFDMVGISEFTASILISGKVYVDKLNLPGAFGIDDRPNGSPLSIREQLREVGIIAIDVEDSLTEDNITA